MASAGAGGGTDAVITRAIARWRSRMLSERAQHFAREATLAAAPCNAGRAKALLFAAGRLGGVGEGGRARSLFAAGRLAAFGERVGLELSPGVLLSEATIERLVLVGCDGLSPASVRTLRTNLRALARSLERYPEPGPVALPREHAKRPYSPAEIDGYLRLAGALSTERRRMRATALICLGAGAGIIAGELRGVRGSDVVQRAGGVLVVISGRRARSVPVLARYQVPLLQVASFAGENLIVGGREPGRRHLTGAVLRAVVGGR